MSFILMLILAMVAADLLWWSWAHAVLRPLRRRVLWRSLLALFMAIQLGSLVLIVGGRMLGERADDWLPTPLLSGVFLWHFILVPVAVAIWAGDGLTGAIIRARRWLTPASPPAADAPAVPGTERPGAEVIPLAAPASLSRRDVLRAAAAAVPPVATVLATGVSIPQLNSFRIRPLEVALPRLPAALDGLTIAHVTDIHVGRFTSGAVLGRIVEATNDLRADLVLLTGDLINHALSDLPAGLDAVRRMKARYGVYMCEGNHDLIESRRGFEQGVRSSGVPMLINESAMLRIRGEDVQVLGLRWGSSGLGISSPPARSDAAIDDSMRVLLPQLQAGAFPILLAHHPHAFDPAAAAGIPLTLAGHTHGGQLMASSRLGFGPWMFRYWSGIYAQRDSRLVVSNGVGNWFPVRINAPAEIIHLTLRRDGSARVEPRETAEVRCDQRASA